MSNTNFIDASGIHIQTIPEIISDIVNGTATVNGLVQIYGSGINVKSNSPDGQMVNIYALAKEDVLQLIAQDYNSKDPDQAVGVALDGVSQLCGIFRHGGTYCQVGVQITANQTVNLIGLDNPNSVPFTVSDSLGNQFQLLNSVTLTSGNTVCVFQSVNIGYIQVLPNTLTVPVTGTLGVVAVTNLTVPAQNGTNEETDAQFRIRRQASVSAPSKGYFQSLVGNLLALDGVSGALVVENNSGSTDSNGILAHSIWAIVDGGVTADIANAIYATRSAGCGMKGSINTAITQVDNSVFNVYFDRVSAQDLHLKMHVDVIASGALDENSLKSALVANYVLGIYEPADVSSIISYIKSFNPAYIVSNTQLSLNGVTWVSSSLYPPTKDKKFVLTTGNITLV